MVGKVMYKLGTILYEHFNKVGDDVVQEFLTETTFHSAKWGSRTSQCHSTDLRRGRSVRGTKYDFSPFLCPDATLQVFNNTLSENP